MSIQNSTLHYHLPLVTGTDRPIFSDYNATMELLDELLYSAVSNVEVFAGQIATLQQTSGEHTTELAELDTFKTEQEGINSANAARFLAINQTLNEQVVTNNNKFNSVSIADAYDATRTYNVGDVVTYNGDRYRCITAVTTGEPFDADKWQGEDVQTVLSQLNSDLSDLENALSSSVGNYHIIDATNSSTDIALTLGFDLASKRQVAVALAQRSAADNKWQLFNMVTVGVPTFKNVHNVQSLAYSATLGGSVRAVISYDTVNDTILMHSSDSSFYALAFYVD